MASRSYSACSILNTCWLKCCCSFSLARLMQNCSKSFSLKHSKPDQITHNYQPPCSGTVPLSP